MSESPQINAALQQLTVNMPLKVLNWMLWTIY